MVLYFEDNPTLYIVSMHFSGLFGGIISLAGILITLYRSPDIFSPFYRALNAGHLIAGFLFHVTYCGGSTPIIVLPIHGGFSAGLMGFYQLYVGYQLVIECTLILVAGASMIPLFYYRMSNILRKNHLFNHLIIKIFIYSMSYSMPLVLTPVLTLATIFNSNQQQLKREMIQKYGFFTRKLNLTERDLILVDNRTIPFRLTIFMGLLGLITLLIITISYTNIIFYVLNKQSDVIAEATRKMHRKCTLALVYQMATPLFLILSAIIGGTVLFWTGSNHSDFLNIFAFIIGIAIPIESMVMLLTFSPYRKFVFTAFDIFRSSAPSPPNVSPASIRSIRITEGSPALERAMSIASSN